MGEMLIKRALNNIRTGMNNMSKGHRDNTRSGSDNNPPRTKSTDSEKKSSSMLGLQNLGERIIKLAQNPFVQMLLSSAFSLLVMFLSLKLTNDNQDSKDVTKLMTQMENLETNNREFMSEIKAEIEELDDKVDQLRLDNTAFDVQLQNTIKDVDNLNLTINGKIIRANEVMINILRASYETEENIYETSGKTVFINKQENIGVDVNSKEVYTVEDLENENIILSYKDQNGEEVFFKGQYNEKGQWNKHCIINRYSEDGKLVMIMDAQYQDGVLVSYKQVFPGIDETIADDYNGNQVWYVSERIIQSGYNSGETWIYFRTEDYQKRFNGETLKGSDILSKDDFCSVMDLKQAGYYNGATSDGRFNDDSGNAYLVKYAADGYIRYLYVGKFVDGFSADTSGNAWSIVWGYDNKWYYYYEGSINKNQHDMPRKILQDEIDEIVGQYNFNFEMKWRVTGEL